MLGINNRYNNTKNPLKRIMTMNATRRLEEFIIKLNTRQNEHDLFDKTNELKLKSYFNDLKMSEDNAVLITKLIKKFAYRLIK